MESSMADTSGGGAENTGDPILELQPGPDNHGVKDGQHLNETACAASEEQNKEYTALQVEKTLKPEKAKSAQQEPELESQPVQTTTMAEDTPEITAKFQSPVIAEYGLKEATGLIEDPIAPEMIDFTTDPPSINSHNHAKPIQSHRAVSIETLNNAPRGDGEVRIDAASAPKRNTGDNNQRDRSGSKNSFLPIRSRNSHNVQAIPVVNGGVGYDLEEKVVDSEDRERDIVAREAHVALLRWKIANMIKVKTPVAELPDSFANNLKFPTGTNHPESNQRLERMHVAQNMPDMLATSGNIKTASHDLDRPLAYTATHLAPLNLQSVPKQVHNEPMVRPMEPSFHQDIFSRPSPKQQAIVQTPQSAYTHGYLMNDSGLTQSHMHGVQQGVALSAQKSSKLHRQQIDEHDCGEESDDDEPLITRTKRHPSIAKVSGSGSKLSMEKGKGKDVVKDPDDSDVEWVKSNPKGAALASPISTNVFDQSSTVNAAQSTTQEDAPDNCLFDWKIPKYEVLYEAPASKDEPAIARVSIPGAPRENMFLSPDHEQQEMELLLNIFLPGQQKLEKPDPEPAHAILNFHTIAVMVIEAYKQFEIGDEFGTGRGHWHNDHDQGNEEYERLRDARDADPDEIFFSVIDRWRTGLEVKKQPCQMIRGAQEFCDTALDIIYYFKENGLIVEPKRANRSDKGVKRGLKATGSNTSGLGQSGSKRAGGTEVNEIQARKKVKTDTKAKAPSKKKSDAGVSVVRTPKK